MTPLEEIVYVALADAYWKPNSSTASMARAVLEATGNENLAEEAISQVIRSYKNNDELNFVEMAKEVAGLLTERPVDTLHDESCREFEKWCNTPPNELRTGVYADDGQYIIMETRISWNAWQFAWNAHTGHSGDGWQPIATAPKDGTEVDLWLGDDEFPMRAENCSFRSMTEGEYWAADKPLKGLNWFDCLGYRYKPTHWMAKPPPPKPTSQEPKAGAA